MDSVCSPSCFNHWHVPAEGANNSGGNEETSVADLKRLLKATCQLHSFTVTTVARMF